MCSLSGAVLVLGVFSAAVCCSTADGLGEGDEQDHNIADDSDGQGHDNDPTGEADFNTRILEALKQNPNRLEEQLAECSNMHQDCKKMIDEDRVVSHVAMIAYREMDCLDTAFRLLVKYIATVGPNKAEALDSFFSNICNEVPSVTKCLKNAYGRLQSCVCDVEINAFSIVPVAITDVLMKECTKDKTRFVGIKNSGGLVFWKQHVKEVEKCTHDVFAWPSPLWAKIHKFSSDSLAQLLVHRYEAVGAFKRCLGGIGNGQDTTLKYLDSLTGLALQDMRCVNDKSNTLASCTEVGGIADGSRPAMQYCLCLAVIGLVMALLNNTPILS